MADEDRIVMFDEDCQLRIYGPGLACSEGPPPPPEEARPLRCLPLLYPFGGFEGPCVGSGRGNGVPRGH